MASINNKKDPLINRGFELMLRRKPQKPKTFIFCFEKLLVFLKREINVYINFSLSIRKLK